MHLLLKTCNSIPAPLRRRPNSSETLKEEKLVTHGDLLSSRFHTENEIVSLTFQHAPADRDFSLLPNASLGDYVVNIGDPLRELYLGNELRLYLYCLMDYWLSFSI